MQSSSGPEQSTLLTPDLELKLHWLFCLTRTPFIRYVLNCPLHNHNLRRPQCFSYDNIRGSESWQFQAQLSVCVVLAIGGIVLSLTARLYWQLRVARSLGGFSSAIRSSRGGTILLASLLLTIIGKVLWVAHWAELLSAISKCNDCKSSIRTQSLEARLNCFPPVPPGLGITGSIVVVASMVLMYYAAKNAGGAALPSFTYNARQAVYASPLAGAGPPAAVPSRFSAAEQRRIDELQREMRELQHNPVAYGTWHADVGPPQPQQRRDYASELMSDAGVYHKSASLACPSCGYPAGRDAGPFCSGCGARMA